MFRMRAPSAVAYSFHLYTIAVPVCVDLLLALQQQPRPLSSVRSCTRASFCCNGGVCDLCSECCQHQIRRSLVHVGQCEQRRLSPRQHVAMVQEFYIGELAPEEVPLVPCSERPSPEFLQQLREFTPWRMAVQSKMYKSF